MMEIEGERRIEFEREMRAMGDGGRGQRVRFKTREECGSNGLLSASLLSSRPQRTPQRGKKGWTVLWVRGGEGEELKSLSSHLADILSH